MKSYYHIKLLNGYSNKWSIGESIRTPSNESNHFQKSILRGLDRITSDRRNNQRFLDYASDFIDENDFNKFDSSELDTEMTELMLEEKYSGFQHLASELLKCNFQYLKWIREEIFENIRLKYYEKIPSRKKGIWICENEYVKFWWDEIGKNSRKEIYEIKLADSTKLHKADELYVKLTSLSPSELENNAHQYWKGIINSDSNIEILYEGELIVINKFESIDEWQKTNT
ncbi:DUF2441 domain-containing protein [Flagellimonas myxillae]|uniref:DUF2441 domain-containing protein n=1 Tax=Flagellimonas myxillae TaxID=2942214 RepID=UPI00201F162E|nr:DUF2441 domain-containing protein [Muricauda myxillae]MCL6267199.1 DUF2441 domain-containing protein [Muricauda myxillae]